MCWPAEAAQAGQAARGTDIGAGAGAGSDGERDGSPLPATPVGVDVDVLLRTLLAELPLSRAVKVAERATGLPHRALYQAALAISAAS